MFSTREQKHVDAKYHFIRELVNNGEIVLQHCRIEEQFDDIITKPLVQKSFNYLKKCLGMADGGSCD